MPSCPCGVAVTSQRAQSVPTQCIRHTCVPHSAPSTEYVTVTSYARLYAPERWRPTLPLMTLPDATERQGGWRDGAQKAQREREERER
eukprot:6559210-Prymnesium_polylepis.1